MRWLFGWGPDVETIDAVIFFGGRNDVMSASGNGTYPCRLQDGEMLNGFRFFQKMTDVMTTMSRDVFRAPVIYGGTSLIERKAKL